MRAVVWTVAGCLATLSGGCNSIEKAERRVAEEKAQLPDPGPITAEIHQAQRDWAWVTGSRWTLALIEGEPVLDDATITLAFGEHTWLRGSSGCNTYSGSYARFGVWGLLVHDVGATKMFCGEPEGVMQQESRFLRLLESAGEYQATRETLHLLRDGRVVLSFVAE